jgi:hypothetical protein
MVLELLLIRKNYSLDCTIGELFIIDRNSKKTIKVCNTLEDASTTKKIKGESCIPVGKYDVRITMSNRFKKMLPLLIDVPNYVGVRIHKGNTEKDTEGCILVGMHTDGKTRIWNCQPALDAVMRLIEANKRTTLEIV